MIPKNWTTLLNYNQQLNETAIHLKKGYKICLQVVISVNIPATIWWFIATFTKKTNYMWGLPNVPPPRQLEIVNSDKYLRRWFCSEKLRFLIPWVTSSTLSTIIPLVRSYHGRQRLHESVMTHFKIIAYFSISGYFWALPFKSQ